jgi:hypothetical protein
MKKFIQFFIMIFASVWGTSNAVAYGQVSYNPLFSESANYDISRLEGLAAVVSTPAAAKLVADLKKNAVTKVMTGELTKGQKGLYDKRSKLSPQAQADIENGTREFTDSAIYHFSSAVSAVANIINLVQPGTDTFAVGHSSLDQTGKIPYGKDSLVSFISLQVAEYLTASGMFSAAYTSLLTNDVLFNAVVVTLEVNGIAVLQDIPASRFIENRTDKQLTTALGTGFHLNKPILIPAGASVNVKMQTAATITPAASSAFAFKVELIGDGLRMKG